MKEKRYDARRNKLGTTINYGREGKRAEIHNIEKNRKIEKNVKILEFLETMLYNEKNYIKRTL